MPLSDLAHLSPQPEHEMEPWEPAPDDGLRALFPSDPGYIASVYLDSRRFWGEAQLAQLKGRYEARFPGRTIHFQDLSPEALRYRRLSLFPEMEQLFRQQGHVCDLEGRGFGSGGQVQVVFERHQREALDMSVFLLWEMLRLAGQELNLWDPQGGRTSAEHSEIVETEIALQLGHLLGRYGGAGRGHHGGAALVEEAGMLLGCERVTGEHRIHLAQVVTPRSAWKAAQQDETCRVLFGRTPSAIRAQAEREIRDAGILFDHRRDWPEDHAQRLTRGQSMAPVTPAMVATWYSQVVTSLRKVVWETHARGTTAVAGHEVRREAAFHPRPIGITNVPRPNITASMQAYVDHAADTEAQRLSEAYDTWITPDQVTAGFDRERWLTAPLHGTTLNHAEPFEEPEVDWALAAWIGELKRTGHGLLDVFDAERFLDLLDNASGERSRFFFNQFSEAVWEALSGAATDVDASGKTLEVTYTWYEDPTRPWAVERTPDLLAIRGPLLSFPTCEAAEWATKASFIRQQEAFLAPAPRPAPRRR